jgi:glycosyltransferase involved in cell wall biosynthesis
VVGVDSGAVPDRVAGSGAAELYRRDDPASAAAALRRMMARLSPELSRQARAHAVRAYDWERTFDALLALYAQLARGGSARCWPAGALTGTPTALTGVTGLAS